MGFRRWARKSVNKASHKNNRVQPTLPIEPDLKSTISGIQFLLKNAPDLQMRTFTIEASGRTACLLHLEGLSDKSALNNNILRPLMQGMEMATVADTEASFDLFKVAEAILQGRSALFLDGENKATLFNTQGWPQRAIEDPQVEASIKGSHQGFIETGGQNIALIRRYIPDCELKIKELTVGRRGKTKVSLLFLDDVAHPDVQQELEDRIQMLDIDAVINSGELEELIEDNPYSPFPQFIFTERPDSAASQILQGRIAVVVDRSPGVLVGPASFSTFFQSVDDYSMRWQVATFLRILRYFAFLVTIFLPAIYISLISYNFEVIPIQLLLTVGESRASVPFPPLLEAFIMELSLEMLREAGIRLPAPIGQTVGIVGAIVIGQATVQAGLVSNIMVIVVSLTGLASFIIPSHDMASAIRLIRFPMMIAASMFGLVAISVGLIILCSHLVALESLGTPYFSPISPLRFADWKDTFVRLPMWKMDNRPLSARPVQEKRQKPSHPKGDG